MKYNKYILMTALLLSGRLLQAQTFTNYVLSPDYAVSIHGGSNLHDWTEAVKNADGTCIVHWNPDGTFDLVGMKLLMEVKGIRSTEGSVMNNKTYSALRSGQYPNIVFTLTTEVKAIQAGKGNDPVNATGTLAIAGVTRQVTLHAALIAGAHGKIGFEGSEAVKMSDYNVQPPTALFGALKVTNDVSIRFKTYFTTNTQ